LVSKKRTFVALELLIKRKYNLFIQIEMKKAKLYFNFLSAADKMFSMVAVLFTVKVTAIPVVIRVPFSPRR